MASASEWVCGKSCTPFLVKEKNGYAVVCPAGRKGGCSLPSLRQLGEHALESGINFKHSPETIKIVTADGEVKSMDVSPGSALEKSRPHYI